MMYLLQTIAKEKKKNMNIIDQDKTTVQAKIQEIKMMLDTKNEVVKKSNSEMIKFMKEKPAISNFILPTVSQLQLPSFIDEHLQFLKVVQSCTSSENSKILHHEDKTVQHKVPSTTDDSQVKQSMTTEENDHNRVPQSAKSRAIDVQIFSRHRYNTDIQNVAFVDEDRVWFSGYNSKSLMLANTKGQILKQIPTELIVTHFTIATSGDIITAHLGDDCIQVMSETGQVTTTIETAPDSPSGICLTNDKTHLAVCLYSPELASKLALFGLDGQRKNTFQYTDRKPTTFYAQRVTTNQSGDYCVAHSGLYTVFVVSKSGTLEYTYDGSSAIPRTGSFKPFDIACDKYNNLLVSDYCNNAIHMVDQQGKFMRYLVTSEHEVVDPRGLRLDKEGKLLIGLKDGTLLVFKYLE